MKRCLPPNSVGGLMHSVSPHDRGPPRRRRRWVAASVRGAAWIAAAGVVSKFVSIAVQFALGWLLGEGDFAVYGTASRSPSSPPRSPMAACRSCFASSPARYAELVGPAVAVAAASSVLGALILTAFAIVSPELYETDAIRPLVLVLAATCRSRLRRPSCGHACTSTCVSGRSRSRRVHGLRAGRAHGAAGMARFRCDVLRASAAGGDRRRGDRAGGDRRRKGVQCARRLVRVRAGDRAVERLDHARHLVRCASCAATTSRWASWRSRCWATTSSGSSSPPRR